MQDSEKQYYEDVYEAIIDAADTIAKLHQDLISQAKKVRAGNVGEAFEAVRTIASIPQSANPAKIFARAMKK